MSIVAPTIDVHLDTDWRGRTLRDDVTAGLGTRPLSLPPKWFYDERGSALFDQITRLDEYYPTRREAEILTARAGEIAHRSEATTLVELGSGTSEKTRVLIGALRAGGSLRRFVPFDVSEEFLRTAAATIAADHPGLRVHGVVGDFEHHLGEIPDGERRLVIFLGGTIGNLTPVRRAGFLADLAAALDPGDWFLLGTDLVKDPDRLLAAYDDAAGVTAEFNRNVLQVINSELAADFEPRSFAHVVRWSPTDEWIEMALRSEADQSVHIDALAMSLSIERGEEIHTEVSAKFHPGNVVRELAAAGFETVEQWTDVEGDFLVTLAARGAAPHARRFSVGYPILGN